MKVLCRGLDRNVEHLKRDQLALEAARKMELAICGAAGLESTWNEAHLAAEAFKGDMQETIKALQERHRALVGRAEELRAHISNGRDACHAVLNLKLQHPHLL